MTNWFRSAHPASGWIHWIPPLIVSIVTFAHYIYICMTAGFGVDEALTYFVATDPSFTHFLDAQKDCINTSPPLYFMMMWAWDKIFGASVWSFRFLSAVGLSASAWIVWSFLRRYFSYRASAVALITGFLLTQDYLPQAEQCRYYALMLPLAAVLFWHLDYLYRTPTLRPGDYLIHGVLHEGLILTHSFGILYSGITLLCVFIGDIIRYRMQIRLFSWPLYFAIIGSWIVFALLWIKPFIYHLTAFRPYSWIPVPTLNDFRAVLAPTTLLLYVGCLLVIGVILKVVNRYFSKENTPAVSSIADDNSRTSNSPDRPISVFTYRQLLLHGLSWLVLPAAMAYVVSHTGTSCFLSRYFLPSIVGRVVVIAFLFTAVLLPDDQKRLPGSLQANTSRLATFAIAVICLLVTIMNIPREWNKPFRGLGRAYEKAMQAEGIAENIPLVVPCSLHDFPAMVIYQQNKRPLYWVYDDEYALLGTETRYNYVLNMIVHGLGRHYLQNQIVSHQTVLQSYNRFCVLESSSPDYYTWTKMRLLSNGEYRIVKTLPIPEKPKVQVLVVERRSQ